MSKTRKKKNENFTINNASEKNQTLLSKYFFCAATNSSNFRKRSPSSASGAGPSKTPKFNDKSKMHLAERSDINNFDSQESSISKINRLDTENEDTCANSEPSASKLKLLPYIYSRTNKSNYKADFKHLESSRYTRNTNAANHGTSLMEIGEINPPTEENDQEISPHTQAVKYTPLEKQYLEFQSKYPDAVLLIECGYKYRFFGKDAEIAFKDLNIGCYQYHNFLSASIPTHRLHYHVRRLVLKGHKVGVIKQTESTALKAVGETKNELFARELHAMYTKSTFIEAEFSTFNDENCIEVDDIEEDTVSGYLICINETAVAQNQSGAVNIACVAVQVSSGDVFHSYYQDNFIENELESCLMCINPSEIILPSSPLSKKTENLVKCFSRERSSRIERLDDKFFEHSFALNNMSSYISSQEKTSAASAYDTQDNLQALLSLPSLVISCLSALKTYLSDFKLELILKHIKNMKPFSSVDHMILNATTIRGLEILKSSSAPAHYGTLWWSMNHTSTKFGERLLKSWIVKPLKEINKIEERLNIVTEIIHSESSIFKKAAKMLHSLPDLEKLLCSAFYHKCSCYEFSKLVNALTNVRNELLGMTDRINSEIEVPKVKNILLNILKYLEGIDGFSSNIDSEAAKAGNKIKIFRDTSKYKHLESCKMKISAIEKRLLDLRPAICKILRLPAFKYATVSGLKFLIEVPNSLLSLVPDEWFKYSVTKQVSRFRSPEVIDLCKELDQEQERLTEHAQKAWEEFLDEFGEQFYNYKHAVSNLAELDCYLSFAKVSKSENYCRPLVTNASNRKFEVLQGRHPVVVKIIGEQNQFVSNDINLNEKERCLIVTGPNMGGKSTYIRQTALIALIAHVGCYVPAESATVPLLDGIYVRLGAEDDIVSQKSTFMCEMSEAASILSSATSNSLVILDELGRGTSTNDGAAIAYATLDYLVRKVKCFTLFVTHYPSVLELKSSYPQNILTVHMAYILKDMDEDNDDIETVTFLYNVVSGTSEKSYGINVAALAGVSKDILVEAQRKSREMELKMRVQRRLRSILETLTLGHSKTPSEDT